MEGSVSNFSRRVGGNAYGLGVAFPTVSLELPGVHRPCRDVLRFVVSTVAEARAKTARR